MRSGASARRGDPADYAPGTPAGIAAWNAWFQGMGSQPRDLGKPVFNWATAETGLAALPPL